MEIKRLPEHPCTREENKSRAGLSRLIWALTRLRTQFQGLNQAIGLRSLVQSKLGLVALTLVGYTLLLNLAILFQTTVFRPKSESISEALEASQQDFENSKNEIQTLQQALESKAVGSREIPSSLEYAQAGKPIDQAPGEHLSGLKTQFLQPKKEGVQKVDMQLRPMVKIHNGRIADAHLTSKHKFRVLPSASEKVGHNFQEIYKTQNPERTYPPSMDKSSAQTHRGFTAVASATPAMLQARSAQRLSQKASRSPHISAAAGFAGRVFDARSVGASLEDLSGQGVNWGWDGALSLANASPGLKTLPRESPPPPLGKIADKTPYQGILSVAVGALLLAAVLLALAAQLLQQARHKPSAQATLAQARTLAFASAAAALLAVAMGAVLLKDFSQILQGMMFIIFGGVVAAQALQVLQESPQARGIPL